MEKSYCPWCEQTIESSLNEIHACRERRSGESEFRAFKKPFIEDEKTHLELANELGISEKMAYLIIDGWKENEFLKQQQRNLDSEIGKLIREKQTDQIVRRIFGKK